MSNPESHTPSNEENEAFERWEAFYGEEMLGEPTPEPTEPTPAEVSAPSEDDPKLTIDLVRESINEGRRKAGLEERTDFKDYGTDIPDPEEPTDPDPTDPYEQYVNAIEDAAERHREVEDYQADMKEAADELDATESKGNKVEIGEINIEQVEKDIKAVTRERIEKLEADLKELTPKLGELYAKNRNLITLPKHRAEFNKIKGEYGEILDEYLKLKAREVYNDEEVKISDYLESRLEFYRQEIEELLLDFAGGDLENTDKTQEELDAKKAELVERAHQFLCEEYAEESIKQEAKVNAAFLKDFLAEQVKLESATVDALKNGNRARQFINKVLNNKALKIALAGAAIGGLAITGVGLAAAGASIGFGFTAGGVAAGAAKGAFSGFVMSRQSAEKSAVNQFTTKEAMTSEFEKIVEEHDATESANVASWLLDQYSRANTADKSTNRKRTLVSAGIGAALGGIMSGVQINNVTSEEITTKKFVGHEPGTETYSPDLVDQVNIPKGSGFYTTFEQLGGDPENYEQATEILLEVGKKYGVERVNSPLVADGPFAITHPGKIADWPAEAQTLAREVAQAWADNGLISRSVTRTVGQPVYDTITKTVTRIIPDAFYSFIARATGVVAAGAVGGVVGEIPSAKASESTPTPEPEPEPSSNPESLTEEQTEIADFLRRLLESNSRSLSGDWENILLSSDPLNDETSEKFTNYWDGLDDGQKRTVKILVNTIKSINPVKLSALGSKPTLTFDI